MKNNKTVCLSAGNYGTDTNRSWYGRSTVTVFQLTERCGSVVSTVSVSKVSGQPS
jgi:hypothetical protein